MTSNSVQIFVRQPDGRNLAVNLTEFDSVTVNELMEIISHRTLVGSEFFRLIYGSHNLSTSENDSPTTLSDYKIERDATIHMVPRIRGGHMGIFRFADMTKKENFRVKELVVGGVSWRTVDDGLNFMGKCSSPRCKAYNEFVIDSKGFYKKENNECFLYSEIHKLRCPECGHSIKSNTICGIGLYNCTAVFECKPLHSEAVRFEIEARSEYKYAGCVGDDQKIAYDHFVITVNPLDSDPMDISY